MSLGCTECGKEYSYGRKISFHCVHEHIQFGAIFENERKSHSWNCNCIDIVSTEKRAFESNLLLLEKNKESYAIVFE